MPRHLERPAYRPLDLPAIAAQHNHRLPIVMRPLQLPDNRLDSLHTALDEVFAQYGDNPPCGIAYPPERLGYYLITPAHAVHLTRGKNLRTLDPDTVVTRLQERMPQLAQPATGTVRRLQVNARLGASCVEAAIRGNEDLEYTRLHAATLLGSLIGRQGRPPAYCGPRIVFGHFFDPLPPKGAKGAALEAVNAFVRLRGSVELGPVEVVGGGGGYMRL